MVGDCKGRPREGEEETVDRLAILWVECGPPRAEEEAAEEEDCCLGILALGLKERIRFDMDLERLREPADKGGIGAIVEDGLKESRSVWS
jgi:hypothetical protein